MTVDVEDEGRIVGSEKGAATVRWIAGIRPRPGDCGRVGSTPLHVPCRARRWRARSPEQRARALIDVRDAKERILYFEGEPRFEMKFLRRAVADDKNLEVVALQRTADNKYMRILDGEPEELVGGFPKTREELFAYRGLILGSVEAGAFSGDQLQMIADFVDRRGGGLLMLGGARSFGEGGYGGTPVADALLC